MTDKPAGGVRILVTGVATISCLAYRYNGASLAPPPHPHPPLPHPTPPSPPPLWVVCLRNEVDFVGTFLVLGGGGGVKENSVKTR